MLNFKLYMQEPVSHVVARPSPSDILEWRKFVSHAATFLILIYIEL